MTIFRAGPPWMFGFVTRMSLAGKGVEVAFFTDRTDPFQGMWPFHHTNILSNGLGRLLHFSHHQLPHCEQQV